MFGGGGGGRRVGNVGKLDANIYKGIIKTSMRMKKIFSVQVLHHLFYKVGVLEFD